MLEEEQAARMAANIAELPELFAEAVTVGRGT
jgi:hypothetical protein